MKIIYCNLNDSSAKKAEKKQKLICTSHIGSVYRKCIFSLFLGILFFITTEIIIVCYFSNISNLSDQN